MDLTNINCALFTFEASLSEGSLQPVRLIPCGGWTFLVELGKVNRIAQDFPR